MLKITTIGRHEAFLKSKCDQSIKEPRSQNEVFFQKGEIMKIEESWKVSIELSRFVQC